MKHNRLIYLKGSMFKENPSIKKIATIFLMIVFIMLAVISLLPIKYSLTIAVINLSQNDVLQVFYDIGSGFNEADSKTRRMPLIGKSLQDPATSLLTISLPPKQIRAIRIDPGTGPAAWNLESIILESKLAGLVLRSHTWLPEDIVRDFKPLHAIDTFSVRNKRLFLNASGNDPYFAYKDDFRKVCGPFWATARQLKVTVWIITALLAFFLIFLNSKEVIMYKS